MADNNQIETIDVQTTVTFVETAVQANDRDALAQEDELPELWHRLRDVLPFELNEDTRAKVSRQMMECAREFNNRHFVLGHRAISKAYIEWQIIARTCGKFDVNPRELKIPRPSPKQVPADLQYTADYLKFWEDKDIAEQRAFEEALSKHEREQQQVEYFRSKLPTDSGHHHEQKTELNAELEGVRLQLETRKTALDAAEQNLAAGQAALKEEQDELVRFQLELEQREESMMQHRQQVQEDIRALQRLRDETATQQATLQRDMAEFDSRKSGKD